MPPQTPDPQGPATNPAVPKAAPAPVPQSASAHVDLDRVLLPKKEGTPSVDSAQRINAGILFEQERSAGEKGSPAQEGGRGATRNSLGAAEDFAGSAAPPSPAPAPKPEQPLVKPLQTYQSDIESLVDKKNVSVVTIAAAEADRRANIKDAAQEASAQTQEERGLFRRHLLSIVAGTVLIALAVGAGLYIYMRLQPVPIAEQLPAPFILVDDTQTVKITQNDGRGAVMQLLAAARDKVTLSLGLVARIQATKPTAAGDLQEMSAPEFLQLLAPRIPPELLRTLEPQMLLGVHSYAGKEMFLIMRADSYQTAYSGMLAWESTMQADLSPLFARAPIVHGRAPAASQNAPIAAPATSTATSTASTTAQSASTTQETAPQPVQFFQGNFIDQVVNNRDTRAILNKDGDLQLLWTFLDRNTIVITTNDATLREVVSRLSQASVISLPAGQR